MFTASSQWVAETCAEAKCVQRSACECMPRAKLLAPQLRSDTLSAQLCCAPFLHVCNRSVCCFRHTHNTVHCACNGLNTLPTGSTVCATAASAGRTRTAGLHQALPHSARLPEHTCACSNATQLRLSNSTHSGGFPSTGQSSIYCSALQALCSCSKLVQHLTMHPPSKKHLHDPAATPKPGPDSHYPPPLSTH
jgi:hypothetical protein